jgi:hypothetical protein
MNASECKAWLEDKRASLRKDILAVERMLHDLFETQDIASSLPSLAPVNCRLFATSLQAEGLRTSLVAQDQTLQIVLMQLDRESAAQR